MVVTAAGMEEDMVVAVGVTPAHTSTPSMSIISTPPKDTTIRTLARVTVDMAATAEVAQAAAGTLIRATGVVIQQAESLTDTPIRM